MLNIWKQIVPYTKTKKNNNSSRCSNSRKRCPWIINTITTTTSNFNSGTTSGGLQPTSRNTNKELMSAVVSFPLYVEQLLSRVGRILLSAESIMNIAPMTSFNRVGKTIFSFLWWLQQKKYYCKHDWKGWRQTTPSLTFKKYHLKWYERVEREVLSSSKFADRWMDVGRMVSVKGTILNIHL